ncbi:hypothetical protein K438DRAFT_1999430 [Mycena galopus ATCC 62051]|nr:hypothetical protein K438DRAFT_1999430 [Mycena galopus ATCC 62051]
MDKTSQLLKELARTSEIELLNEVLDDWLTFTLGSAIVINTPQEAIYESRLLFIKVLFIRYQHQGGPAGEELAYQLLETAQMSSFHSFFRYDDADTPANFSLNEDLELRESWCDDPDSGDRDSDWEDEDNVWEDEDYVPDFGGDKETSTSEDNMILPSDELDHCDLPGFVDAQDALRALPTKTVLQPELKLDDLPLFWVGHIQDFFCSNTPDERDAKLVVDDLVAMRKLTLSQYRSPKFLEALKTSTLFDHMRAIARPGNLLETSHPDVEASFRWHNWKLSYAELICRWIQPTLEPVVSEKNPKLKYEFSLADACGLLEFIDVHPRMQPWGFNPVAVYLFISLHCFKTNCDLWLVPCLQTLHYPKLEGWDPEKVYQRLMELPIFRTPPLTPPSKSTEDFTPILKSRLAVVVQETMRYRTFMHNIGREIYRPSPEERELESDSEMELEESEEESEDDEMGSDLEIEKDWDAAAATNTTSQMPKPIISRSTKRSIRKKAIALKQKKAEGAGPRAKHQVLGNVPDHTAKTTPTCPFCKNRPMHQHCIRIVYVEPRRCKQLIGSALTCAPVHDRLQPKPQPKPKDGTRRKHAPKIKYLHPVKDLKMRTIRFRNPVYKRCGKDIVRFIWRRPDGVEEIVGGVRYKPFSKPTLARLVSNHRLVKVRAIRRREILQRWAYGTMTARGSRQPIGGRKGDVYGPYACHRGDTRDDIKALFRDAMDADVLVEAGNTIFPGMKAELKQLTAFSGMNQLGSTGVVNFACTNYISCIHPDADLSYEDAVLGRGKDDGLGSLRSCGQLGKTGCGRNDYNFAYVRWGIVIEQ